MLLANQAGGTKEDLTELTIDQILENLPSILKTQAV